MASRIRAANTALYNVLRTAFADAALKRNPSGHTAPRPRSGGLAAYVAMIDDNQPEVVSAFAGQCYDLAAMPLLVFGFVGASEDDRFAAAWAQIEILKAAIAADLTLGDVVEHAQVEAPQDIEPGEAQWLAGGLEVTVKLLFNAPTLAG